MPSVSVSPWSKVEPTGIAHALVSFYSIAAPVFAGFAATFTGLVMTSRSAFPAADLVLTAAVVSVGAFVFTIQLGMHAQQYATSPTEYLSWYPMAAHDPTALYELRRTQHNDHRHWEAYRARASRMYRIGIVTFLFSLLVAVLPPTMPAMVPYQAWMSLGPVVAAVIYLLWELNWIFAPRWGAGRWLRIELDHEEPNALPKGVTTGTIR